MPGIRQKIEEATQTRAKRFRGGEADEEKKSPLAIELLRLWSMGLLSAVAVQKLANAALLEGAGANMLAEMAALGSWGENSSHVHRELVALASRGMKIHEGIVLQVPALNNKKNPRTVNADFAILPPHLFFHSTAKHHAAHFESIWNFNSIPNFWDSVLPDDPRLANNPMLHVPNYKRSFIPLWVHGDGVEFSTDSMLVFSTGSLLSKSSTMDSSSLIAAWPKSATSKTATHDTWQLPFKVMSWSFQALFDGKHPAVDWNGEPFSPSSEMAQLAGKDILPNGLRCIVWALLGDLEYFANVLKYPHWKKIEFCWLCNCSRHDETRHWCDFSLEPGWSARDHEWHAANPCTSHSFVMSLPGVLPAYLPALDVLHVLDQGLILHVLGSVLHIWVYDDLLPAATALSNIWENIRGA